MGAIRLDLIRRYLRPHRKVVLIGVAALVVVNLLSVSIPLLVRRVIDDLQDGFSLQDVLAQAGLIVALATVMGAVRLYSRMQVFGVGRQVEADLKQQIFDHLLLQGVGLLERGLGLLHQARARWFLTRELDHRLEHVHGRVLEDWNVAPEPVVQLL